MLIGIATARLEVADPLWAAARGAALYAQLRQKLPWNCTEPKGCRNHAEFGASETAQQVIWENGGTLRIYRESRAHTKVANENQLYARDLMQMILAVKVAC
jgi:hypothetical protein